MNKLSKSMISTNSVLSITATGTKTVLTSSSSSTIIVTGSNWQDIELPDASTCYVGQKFTIYNATNNYVYILTNDQVYTNNLYWDMRAEFTCVTASGTTINSWVGKYSQGYNSTYCWNLDIEYYGSSGRGGILFPSTQNPSSNVNMLDDYEEGTWTPVVKGADVTGTGTYTTQLGYYTKIGNLVQFSAEIVITAHDGSGSLYIDGLPFTNENYRYSGNLGKYTASTGLNSTASFTVEANSTQIYLWSIPKTTVSSARLSLTSSFTLTANGFYRI